MLADDVYDLEWTCKCFDSVSDCEKDKNGSGSTKFTLPSDYTWCHSVDFKCGNTEFKAVQAGNAGLYDRPAGALYFETDGYCIGANTTPGTC